MHLQGCIGDFEGIKKNFSFASPELEERKKRIWRELGPFGLQTGIKRCFAGTEDRTIAFPTVVSIHCETSPVLLRRQYWRNLIRFLCIFAIYKYSNLKGFIEPLSSWFPDA